MPAVPPRPVVVHENECAVEGGKGPGRVRWRTLLSADRTPSDQLTVGVAELDPGQESDPLLHRHAQPEVYYILEGEGFVRVGDEEHPIRAGTTVFIPGGALHRARNTGTTPMRLLYVFPTASFRDVEYEFPDAPERS